MHRFLRRRYAQRMADRIDAELEFAKRAGKGHEASVLELGDIAKGWRFTAIAVAESYDGEY